MEDGMGMRYMEIGHIISEGRRLLRREVPQLEPECVAEDERVSVSLVVPSVHDLEFINPETDRSKREDDMVLQMSMRGEEVTEDEDYETSGE